MISFWVRTNKLIKDHGYTQDTLCKLCGFYDPRRIQNLSGGNRLPKPLELVEIAKHLKTSVEYLLTGEDFLVTETEREMLQSFNLLNDDGKRAALRIIRGLLSDFPLTKEDGASSKTAT